jgi:peptidyl-prolyl cis-trans isomerase D
MLRQLRTEKFKKGLLIGILIIIIPSFITFYGWQQSTGMGPDGNPNVPATIKFDRFDKVEVPASKVTEARRALQSKVATYARLTGKPLDNSIMEKLTGTPDLVNEAVDVAIWEKLARDSGVVVTNQGTLDFVAQQVSPAERIQLIEALRQQGRSFDDFIAEQRQGQMLQMSQQLVAPKVRVSLLEAWIAHSLASEKLVADVVKFPVADYVSKVAVTEDALKAYFDQNREKFRIPDQLRYAFLVVRKNDLKSSVTVSDDEVTSYYAANREDYRLPASVAVRQIFLKRPQPVPGEANDDLTSKTAEVAAKAQALKDALAKGEDFAALAEKNSEETVFAGVMDAATTAAEKMTTASGYLGFVREDAARRSYGDEWTSAAFSLQPGQLTPAFETARGFHILKAEGRKEGVLQTLDAVRETIVEKLKNEKVAPIFQAIAEDLRAKADKITVLEKLGEATSQTVRLTDKVDKGAPFISGIGLLGDFAEPVRDLQAGGRSEVMTDDNRILIMEIREEFPEHDPPMEERRADVLSAYRESRAREMARADAEKLKALSTDLAAMTSATLELGTTITRTADFTRGEADRVLGPIEDFARVSEGIAKGDTMLSVLGSPEQPTGYVVWRVEDRKPPSRKEFAEQLPRLMRDLTVRKSQTLLQEHMRDRRKELGTAVEIGANFRH